MVYDIQCTDCDQHYIRETARPLRTLIDSEYNSVQTMHINIRNNLLLFSPAVLHDDFSFRIKLGFHMHGCGRGMRYAATNGYNVNA